MYFSDKIDLFTYTETENKYGDKVKLKQFKERIDCVVVDVEIDMKDVAMIDRLVRIITNKPLGREIYFNYDGDFFRVISRQKIKDKYSMLCKREVDV